MHKYYLILWHFRLVRWKHDWLFIFYSFILKLKKKTARRPIPPLSVTFSLLLGRWYVFPFLYHALYSYSTPFIQELTRNPHFSRHISLSFLFTKTTVVHPLSCSSVPPHYTRIFIRYQERIDAWGWKRLYVIVLLKNPITLSKVYSLIFLLAKPSIYLSWNDIA